MNDFTAGGQVRATDTSAPQIRSALWVAVMGLAVATVLVGLGLPSPSPAALYRSMAQVAASNQGLELQKQAAILVAQTDSASHQQEVLHATQATAQPGALLAALGYLPGLVDAYAVARGQAALDNNRPSPVNFVSLDLIRQVEAGARPLLQAQKVGERWLVYSLAPIHDASGTTVLGTLLLSFDLGALTTAFAALPADFGEVELQQRFDQGAAQSLFKTGTAVLDDHYPVTAGNWTLVFTPGTLFKPALQWRSLVFWPLALLLAIGGAWLALGMLARRLREQLAGDARQLTQLIQELSGGKAVKAFSLSLPELNVVAASLARLSLQGNRHASPAAPAMPLPTDTGLLEPALPTHDQAPKNMEPRNAMNGQAHVAPQLPESIFRAYDIRGVFGDTLTAEAAYWIGRAIGSQSLAQGEPNVAVGRDGRLSGPVLVQQLIQGIADCGCHVTDVGLVPTPALYFAANVLAGKSGVMLTGSHNPRDYNGFKIVIAGDTLANEQILALHQRLKDNDLASGQGTVEQVEILDRYVQRIRDDIVLARRLKVVVDCGNGAAGVIAPQLIEALGCEVIPLFCEVDGNFPNHHPDPGKLENLEDLIAKVRETGADLGLAFDGDGDRVGVVTNTGTVVYPDRLLMLFARDVVARNPGADVIFDVKCSRRLSPLISSYGGRPVMWKTGHSLIKKHMKLTGALLAGEMSGHIFFKERWYGFDDGIYSAARLLEILSQGKDSAEALFAAFPNDISTPELNIHVTDEGKFSIIDALQRDAHWGDANLTTIDGVRVDYPKGWGLVRASNTTPVLVLRFEADDQAELERIQDVFRAELQKIAPDLQLPF